MTIEALVREPRVPVEQMNILTICRALRDRVHRFMPDTFRHIEVRTVPAGQTQELQWATPYMVIAPVRVELTPRGGAFIRNYTIRADIYGQVWTAGGVDAQADDDTNALVLAERFSILAIDAAGHDCGWLVNRIIVNPWVPFGTMTGEVARAIVVPCTVAASSWMEAK